MPHATSSGSIYRLFGRALPERGSWWFDRVEVQGVDEASQPQFRIVSEARLSNFSVLYWLADGVGSGLALVDARNAMKGFAQVALDTIGLFEGAAVDCDVVHLVAPDGATCTVDSTFDGLSMEYGERQFQSMVVAGHMLRGVRLGMADFRLAISSPEDTMFLCYRGLEGIRADLAEAESITTAAAAWERMRAVTGLPRAEIDAIKPKADARRHGGVHAASSEERASALRLLRRALLRYVEQWERQRADTSTAREGTEDR